MSKERIQQEYDMYKQIGHEHFFNKFLLLKGVEFEPVPFTEKRMTPKQCYANAIHYGLRHGLDYAEGYLIRKDLPILIHHAWCVDENGKAVDPTISNPEECQYVGVQMKSEKAVKIMVKQGYYGLFDGTTGLNLKLMEKLSPGLLPPNVKAMLKK